jgi:hypothetical protein
VDLSNPYAIRDEGAVDAFVYSPAFAQVITPAKLLSFDVFFGLLTIANLAVLLWLVGPWLALLLLWPGSPVVEQIAVGNINLMIAAAIVLGFRQPAWWGLILLSKVSPAVGLLWFAVRQEWRSLGIAVAATGAVVAVSFALSPSLWFQWFDLLRHNGGIALGTVPIPLGYRVAIAAVVVIWGAMTGRRWTVPVAAFLSLPVIWWSGWSILVAVWPLRHSEPVLAVAENERDSTGRVSLESIR